MIPGEDTSLYELDREEFWPVAKRCVPNLTYEDYVQSWDEFQRKKREGTLELN